MISPSGNSEKCISLQKRKPTYDDFENLKSLKPKWPQEIRDEDPLRIRGFLERRAKLPYLQGDDQGCGSWIWLKLQEVLLYDKNETCLGVSVNGPFFRDSSYFMSKMNNFR